MKAKFLHLTLFFVAFFSLKMSAQIPDGTTAPGWTATDLNGQSWDMYTMLNSGKHVVLEFSATWCGPCWNFHNTGTLETLHDMYGPNGTDQIRVFYIEADQNTNTDCLYNLPGCNSSTQGDWVTGHDFPFIDLSASNAPSMANDYQVSYYPTVYAVSANGNNGVFEVGQETNIQNWASWFFESFEMASNPVVVQADCPGEGSIDLNIINGAGSLDYAWSNGANTPSISGLSAGFYTATITDDNGYSIEETIEILGPSEPLEVDLLASSDINCFGEANGSLYVNGTGGNGGFSYSWSNGSTSTLIDGLTAGVYTVVITDVAGCQTEETYTVSQPDALSLTTISENADCGAENGGVVAFAVGGTGPWQYDYGDAPNYTGTFSGIAPGDYVMTVTDNNGCVDTNPFTITATEGPEAVADAEGLIDCNNTSATVSGIGSEEGANITYAWTTTDGSIIEGSNAIEATVGAAGTYTLVVTNTSTGCTSMASVSVEANTVTPTADIATPQTLTCDITSTTIDASGSSSGGDFTYAWTTTDGNITEGANTLMPTVDSEGTYVLVVTNTTNGCTMSNEVSVATDIDAPAISVTDAVLDCSVSEVELCADVAGNVSVVWMLPSGAVEATCVTVDMAGSYVAVAKGANGCETEATSNVTLSADLPQVSIDSPAAITCTSTTSVIQASVEGDIADFGVQWTNADGDILGTDLGLTVDAGGVYTLTVVNNNNGCTTVSSVSVDEIIVNPVSGFDVSLVDGVLVLNSNSSGDPSTFVWNTGNEGASTEVTFDENGTYEICLTVTNDCGDDTYCQDVEYVTALTYTASLNNSPCFASNSGSISVIPSGGQPDYTITWEGPNGFTASTLTISDLAPGTYTMGLSDDYGYEKSESYTITEASEIVQTQVEITDETGTDANGSITIDVSGGTGALSYLWSNGANTATVSGLSAGEYSVVVTDENGCNITFGPFVVNMITGLAELDFVNEMSIYPNPAFDNITIDIRLNSAQHTIMKVIDTYGKVISFNSFDQAEIIQTMDVSELPSGMYFVEFGNEKERRLEKFVVLK